MKAEVTTVWIAYNYSGTVLVFSTEVQAQAYLGRLTDADGWYAEARVVDEEAVK